MALHYATDRALEELLVAWRRYDDVKRAFDQPDPKRQLKFADLGRARARLDDARSRMNRIRSAMHPTPTEQSMVLKVVLCETLDEIVHLGFDHRVAGDRSKLRCICGELVTVKVSRG